MAKIIWTKRSLIDLDPEVDKKSDYVVLCLPSTEKTKNMFDMNKFQTMKKNSVLVNIGRGDVIKDEDLISALKKKIIAGKNNRIIKTKFGNIGIIICWDIAYPEYIKELSKKGAWIIFCPTYIKNYGRELESYLGLPYSRAFESSCYFVSCDSANKECAQYSVICGPSEIYSEIKGKEGIIFAELDKRKINGVRKRYRLV